MMEQAHIYSRYLCPPTSVIRTRAPGLTPKVEAYDPQNFLMTFFLFLVIENCNKITTQQQWHRRRADKLLAAAARRSTKVGGGAQKLSAAGARLYTVVGRRRHPSGEVTLILPETSPKL